MKKTKYDSYNINGLPEGCKYCVKGKKLVIFISGICSRNCWYCSLSEKRKNKDIILFNERQANSIKEMIKEVKESKATSAGITGGDPLLFLSRTIKYAKALKQTFGKKFHIHIYLPTKLVTKERLSKLSKYLDEVRFNPEYTINQSDKAMKSDIEKIKLAQLFWKKQNIGIELPMIPNQKENFLRFIEKSKDYIGFVNLNEFELSETNCNKVTKEYKLNQGGYTIKDSIKSGLWLINEIKRRNIRLKVHLCTAKLKNDHQFKNRLNLHNILPYGKKTKDGTVKYLVINNPNKKIIQNIKKLNNQYFLDKKKDRILISNKLANKIIKKLNIKKTMCHPNLKVGVCDKHLFLGCSEIKAPKKYPLTKVSDLISDIKILLIEEFPTYDRIEVETQEIN
ncbi:radical SAM protein [Candidatus Pacearchaeota archaeon]|nr:radical SAM protein [Candidatus Pacearchaeota archaeon]